MIVVLSIIALSTTACAILAGAMLREQRDTARALEIQLNGLGETHSAGLELVTISLNRLEARVKRLEDA
jgi:hypothetical protein